MTEKLMETGYEGLSFSETEMMNRSEAYYQLMDIRRTVRQFSDQPVSKQLIQNIIMTASSAPSGAHKQPWTFCAISNPQIKSKIRVAAEKEEYENYHGRMGEEWIEDLKMFRTDWHKPFLEKAPWLIVVFKKTYDIESGQRKKNYYVSESVGIATGFLINAIHYAGLVTLTHTPSPMTFLCEILERPENEKPYLLLPVGYPKKGATVPSLTRKGVNEVIQYFE